MKWREKQINYNCCLPSKTFHFFLFSSYFDYHCVICVPTRQLCGYSVFCSVLFAFHSLQLFLQPNHQHHHHELGWSTSALRWNSSSSKRQSRTIRNLLINVSGGNQSNRRHQTKKQTEAVIKLWQLKEKFCRRVDEAMKAKVREMAHDGAKYVRWRLNNSRLFPSVISLSLFTSFWQCHTCEFQASSMTCKVIVAMALLGYYYIKIDKLKW